MLDDEAAVAATPERPNTPQPTTMKPSTTPSRPSASGSCVNVLCDRLPREKSSSAYKYDELSTRRPAAYLDLLQRLVYLSAIQPRLFDSRRQTFIFKALSKVSAA